MQDKFRLSEESQAFIQDLRVYLLSSGKAEGEIEAIIEELEVHLFEAEQDGKSTEKIIGQSPKDYMKQISDEMAVDYIGIFKMISLIVLGAFSFKILSDLLLGNLSYSLLELSGYLVITLIFILAVFKGFKLVAKSHGSQIKKNLILFSLGFLPLSLFLSLYLLDQVIETPVIHFNLLASFLIGAVTLLFLIGFSVWAKTWWLMIILTLLILPEYLLTFTSLGQETQLILGIFLTFSGIAIYLLLIASLEENR